MSLSKGSMTTETYRWRGNDTKTVRKWSLQVEVVPSLVSEGNNPGVASIFCFLEFGDNKFLRHEQRTLLGRWRKQTNIATLYTGNSPIWA